MFSVVAIFSSVVLTNTFTKTGLILVILIVYGLIDAAAKVQEYNALKPLDPSRYTHNDKENGAQVNHSVLGGNGQTNVLTAEKKQNRYGDGIVGHVNAKTDSIQQNIGKGGNKPLQNTQNSINGNTAMFTRTDSGKLDMSHQVKLKIV